MNDEQKAIIEKAVTDGIVEGMAEVRKVADARVAKANADRDAAVTLSKQLRKTADDALAMVDEYRTDFVVIQDAIVRRIEKLERTFVKSKQLQGQEVNDTEPDRGLDGTLRAIAKASR